MFDWSRLDLVLSIVTSNTRIFYAANDRRCLGIVASPEICYLDNGGAPLLTCRQSCSSIPPTVPPSATEAEVVLLVLRSPTDAAALPVEDCGQL